MFNETFAYPRINKNINWKYLGGNWITSFFNEYQNLVIFYDGNGNDIEVISNGIPLTCEETSLSYIDRINAYIYYRCTGNVEVRIHNVNVSSVTISGFNVNNESIGGIRYLETRINRKTWLAQNLELTDTTLKIGYSYSNDYPRANYYDNDENKYSLHGTLKCGLLYNFKAVEYMQQHRDSLFKGWHIPTLNEWLELSSIDTVSLMSTPKSITNEFPSTYWSGTNLKRLNLIPSGKRVENNFYNINEKAFFWTSTNNKCIVVSKQDTEFTLEELDTESSSQYAIRLIKDY